MNVYEWNGEAYEERHPAGKTPERQEPTQWEDEWTSDEWRSIFLGLLEQDVMDDGMQEDQELLKEAIASFSDGINTGFYINAYTTKHCPTMDGVLTEMRRGLERLEQAREAEQERLKAEAEANIYSMFSTLLPSHEDTSPVLEKL